MTDDEFKDALDTVYARYSCVSDCGDNSDGLIDRVVAEINNGPKSRLVRIVRDWMWSDKRIEDGCGIEDIVSFNEFLESVGIYEA